MNIIKTEDFNKRFAVDIMFYYLLWHERHQYINNAIAREKEIKGWRREKKLQLIAVMNSELNFLNEELFGKWPPEELTERF